MHPCIVLLALLRAARLVHQTAHHLSSGPNFAADHALYGELYEALGDEIDTLAEKAVYMGAPLDAADLAERVAQLTQRLSPTGARTNPDALAKRALEVERAIQEGISAARQTLDEVGALSYGLDNFLAGLADNHEKALYLLSRRTL